MLARKLLPHFLKKLDGADTHLLKPHQGKTVKVIVGKLEFCLRIEAQGKLKAVHQSIDADASVNIPVQRVVGKQEQPIQSECDSELLAALAETFKNEDLSFENFVEQQFGTDASAVVAKANYETREWANDASFRLGNTIKSWLTTQSEIFPEPEVAREHFAKINSFSQQVEQFRQRAVAQMSQHND